MNLPSKVLASMAAAASRTQRLPLVANEPSHAVHLHRGLRRVRLLLAAAGGAGSGSLGDLVPAEPATLQPAGRAAWDNAGMAERPLIGLSLMLEDDFLRAALPLFEAGEVEVLEWSFDVGWGLPALPAWAEELLACYSDQGRLLGHGVTYSALSGVQPRSTRPGSTNCGTNWRGGSTAMSPSTLAS